jgi:hypothetical protein
MAAIRAGLVSLIVCLAITVAKSQTPSLWEHNGSTVSLVARGTARRFIYETPRPGLPESVKLGTLLFEGRRSGNAYDGIAYVFSSRCDPIGYRVHGTVSADDRQVTLEGRAPIRGANCQVTGYKNDPLVFAYQGVSPALERQQRAPALASEQSSSGLIRADPEAQYDLLRRLYTDEIGRLPGSPDLRKTYDLTDCISSDPSIYTPDERAGDFVRLAADVTWISATLVWAGYPTSIWQATLNDFEWTQLRRIVAGSHYGQGDGETFAKLLTAQLDQYRRTSANSVPKVAWQPGCGAGRGLMIDVITVPPNGEIWIIPFFFYKLCAAQRRNPDDRKLCDYWIEAGDFVSGVYRYVASWPMGPTKQGTVNFDKFNTPNGNLKWIVRQGAP